MTDNTKVARPSRHHLLSSLTHRVSKASLQRSRRHLPDLAERSVSTALAPNADSLLGRSARPIADAHPDQSGVTPLFDGRDAFAARVLLADAAEHTLDLQYYIWHDDMSGTLMFDAIRRAARRGVRVRMLLDDNNGSIRLDKVLAALDAEDNIEVRLFNPFTHRRWRALGYLTDFPRLNRRMHNKSFTADNQATIIGGRNVGDEYFGAGEKVLFVDLDVLAVGAVVSAVSEDFDRYWACESAHPTYRLLTRSTRRQAADVAADAERIVNDPKAAAYVSAIRDCGFVQSFLRRELAFEWTKIEMVSDDPRKGLGLARDEDLLWSRLMKVLRTPRQALHLVSPYFVPTRQGTDAFVKLAKDGVRISILTNALEATDVAPVHAGYAKWRKPLLHAGIDLFELQRSSEDADQQAGPEAGHKPRGRARRSGLRDKAFRGSSSSSLHAKTFAVDGARVFIGSFNFDPRSTRLNTELGFVVDSRPMAANLARSFAEDLTRHAYRVRLTSPGELEWIDTLESGEQVVHAHEPGTTWWLRLAVTAMGFLPIDWLL